ncbi:hypothetical protein B0H11DRAFT_2121781 [Mycena galericulata]|nr:hypothetical protein B0H11DRAFT_2121781 [Mycena galericulata]
MSSTQSESPLAPVRRVVTGHNAAGKAKVLDDTVQSPQFWSPEGVSPIYDLHYTSESPAVIDTEVTTGKWVDEIQAHPKEIASPNGSTFRSVDFAPGQVSPMHRTVSLDYAIVFKGSVTLELEEGKRVTLNEGDTVVQRGTMHTWRNETSEWARVYFVVLDAKPITIGGKVLEQEFHKAE